jgi:hypothetical protein
VRRRLSGPIRGYTLKLGVSWDDERRYISKEEKQDLWNIF